MMDFVTHGHQTLSNYTQTVHNGETLVTLVTGETLKAGLETLQHHALIDARSTAADIIEPNCFPSQICAYLFHHCYFSSSPVSLQ